jgi:heme-degrading monooxygenase HmoA
VIAVIFEANVGETEKADYLAWAAELRPLLDEIEGFISIERFQSLADSGKVLSLSFWSDEVAVTTWRTRSEHRSAQAAGKAEVFTKYRLRVCSVIRDYGKDDREQAPKE